MKKVLFSSVLVLSFILTSVSAQQAPIDKANYDLAARFSPTKLKAMVFSTSVDAHWLKNSTRFWYAYETSEGKIFYIADPARSTKKVLFDNNYMASQVSLLTHDPFDAKHLPIEKIKFIKNETILQFQIKSKLVDEELDEDEEDKENDMEEENDQKKKNDKAKKPGKKTFYFEYELATKKLRLLDDYEKPKERPDWANISPDENKVVFARNHNLYWMDKENYELALEDEKDTNIVEHQLTTDGEEYYSYGSGSRGEDNVKKKKNKDKRKSARVLWSPDSKNIALTRDDSRKVKELWVINNTAKPRPSLETYKYQMPGDKNSPINELQLINMESGEAKKIETDRFKDQDISILSAPRKQRDRDNDYNPRIWLSPSSSKIYFSRTSRDLKRIDLCVVDVVSGEVKVLIEERLNTYLEFQSPGLVNGGKELVHWSERDGWAHFYLYDDQGNLKNRITSGPFHCERIVGVDSKNRVLYFTANAKERGEDPYYEHLYRVNLDGTGLKLLNKGNYDNRVSMSDDQTYFVNNYSRVNTIPVSDLMDKQGNRILKLEKSDLSQLFQAGYKFPEPYKVKAADGITDIYGVMYKPFDFDSTRLYPIIEYVYPGPQTEAVNKSFSSRMDRLDRLAQFGFIVVTMGNRGGHPARSKWYHNYGYGNLRDYGLADKKAAAEQLADRHAYIDISKVGIFGHSGGGFMSTAALLVYPDFFKVAVSSSGNHQNNIYNRWWSEKHHGVKEVTDTAGNVSFEYDIAKNADLAKNLKGHLLITTGDMDNNVHPANTITMAKALIKANKRFDYFVFPGQRHGYGDMTEYFFWLRSDYFCKHLIGDFSWNVDITEMNNEVEKKH